jgi:two-component system, chemotaxis family, chemotaxis protein CheY
VKLLLPIRVLLADDAPFMRALIRSSFPKDEHRLEFVEAVDGNEAVALYKGHRCDLVLLDVNMPGRNGLQVLEALRAYDPHVFVVMVSADDSHKAQAQALLLGAEDYVTKPISQEAMRRIITAYRDRKRRPVSVLAVDDSATMLAMLGRGLEILKIPHRLTALGDGRDALLAFEREHVDLVFLDIHLPGVNGLDVLAEMKRRRPDVYIVMVSGDGRSESVRVARAQGADDFLLKPIDPALFRKMWSRFKVMAGVEFLSGVTPQQARDLGFGVRWSNSTPGGKDRQRWRWRPSPRR